ncbi:MAG: hypothetical protein R2705_14780 [Ilumatobacteraceae bacterium]
MLDLGSPSVPVTRALVRTPRRRCRHHPPPSEDPDRVLVRFFGPAGTDISENTQRKIERLFHREDFRRVIAEDIGDIEFPAPRWRTTPSRWAPSSTATQSLSTGSNSSWTTPTGRQRS